MGKNLRGIDVWRCKPCKMYYFTGNISRKGVIVSGFNDSVSTSAYQHWKITVKFDMSFSDTNTGQDLESCREWFTTMICFLRAPKEIWASSRKTYVTPLSDFFLVVATCSIWATTFYCGVLRLYSHSFHREKDHFSILVVLFPACFSAKMLRINCLETEVFLKLSTLWV